MFNCLKHLPSLKTSQRVTESMRLHFLLVCALGVFLDWCKCVMSGLETNLLTESGEKKSDQRVLTSAIFDYVTP